MTIVAVTGDCTTTTCVALASGWPAEVIVLEADPSGGSLAGWLDTPGTPSLSSAVAATTSGVRTVGDTIDSVVQRSRSGIRFIAAPVRSLPARRAIAEAGAAIIPELAGHHDVVALADLGRPSGDPPHLLRRAAVTVVVHRQSPASAQAESVRLERLVEQVEGVGGPVVLAVIGREPFEPDDVVSFIDGSVPGTIIAACRLAEDPLAAAVLAGRTGVSAKRLQRLPLMRSAAEAAALLSGYVASPSDPSLHMGALGRSGSEVGS
ncbi:MAG: hypothetical protein WBL31_12525 [Ilumatobacteraceae bacterium]